MKVFNWVHRRFLHCHSYTNVHQEDSGLEKYLRSKANVERHAFLVDDGHVVMDPLNNWNDGILAIGTLAIGPLETTKYEIIKEMNDDQHEENNYYLDDNTDVMHENDHDHSLAKDNDDLEASPLMKMTLFSHELEKIVGEHKEIEEVASGCIKSKNHHDMSKNEGQTKRRVTLADLFSEDSDHHGHLVRRLKETDDVAEKDIIIVAKPNLKIKTTSRAKNGLSKAKKLLKEELLPVKKFNQLMKRMMKRKIYPDLEGKMQKKEIQMQPSNDLGIPTNEQVIGAHESASLLLIQDSMV